METSHGSSPSSDEAQEILVQLRTDQEAIRYPPFPLWFFPLMAAIMGSVPLSFLLEPSTSSKVLAGLVVVALVPAYKYWFNRDGVAWASVNIRDTAPFLVAILGAFAASAVIAESTGAWWMWILCAAVVAGIVLFTGRAYRREFGG